MIKHVLKFATVLAGTVAAEDKAPKKQLTLDDPVDEWFPELKFTAK
jgi:hypothetical protein